MTRLRACLLVILIWAGIYLPGLGSLDLKGEEPRRSLPALHMLRSGDWLVPRVGAAPYLRKPPLLNWFIAVSFRLGGVHEWTARMPSALAVLACALALALRGARWLGDGGAFLAAIFWLTNLAIMETGRLAELEAVYCSLTGMAFVFWMTAWRAGAGPWRLWTMPAVFLTLGMLEKGPAHLIFFYAAVIGVLARSGEWRALRQPAHLAALACIFGAFAAWAIPCAREVAAASDVHLNIWRFWAGQLMSHSAGAEFHFRDWIQNIPRGLIALFPWTLFLPILRLRAMPDATPDQDREAALIRGARDGCLVAFVLISLLPGTSPRYVYPLLVVPCLLLARVLTFRRDESLIPAWLPAAWRATNGVFLAILCLAALAMLFIPVATRTFLLPALVIIGVATVAAYCASPGGRGIVSAGIVSGWIMAFVTCIYALAAIPRVIAAKTHGEREVASEIRRALPADAVLWISESEYGPFWYYLEPRVAYFTDPSQVPANARYLLLPEKTGKRSGDVPRTPAWPGPLTLLRQVTYSGAAFGVFKTQAAGGN